MSWIGEWWNQVSGTVVQGFWISAVGMVLVFFTLGLVIAAMVLLTRLPWLRVKEQGGEGESRTIATVPAGTTVEPVVVPPVAPAAQDDELERVAAIAVAMLRGRRTSVRPTRVQGARSTWKGYGRAQQLGL